MRACVRAHLVIFHVVEGGHEENDGDCDDDRGHDANDLQAPPCVRGVRGVWVVLVATEVHDARAISCTC